jgi:DNA recombination protein RmuC
VLITIIAFTLQKNINIAALKTQVKLLGEEVTMVKLALAKAENLTDKYKEEKIEHSATSKAKDHLQQQLSTAQVSLAAISATREQELKSSAEKLKLLEQAKNDLSKEFENLANRIFEEKK